MSDVEPVKSHGPSRHVPGCRCTRCIGFERGNTHAVRHGAYSRVQLASRAAEHADWLRDVVPVGAPGDEAAVAALAQILSQLEAASRGLEALQGDHPLAQYVGQLGQGVGDRLRADAARWLRLLLTYAEALSLTPASRAKLGIDFAEARRAQLDLDVLDDQELADLRRLIAKAEHCS